MSFGNKGGRPRNAEVHKAKLDTFNGKVANHLPQTYRNLQALADGEAEGYDDEYKAAGVITRKDVARQPDGTVFQDRQGKPVIIEALCFPHLEPTELVKIRRMERHLPQDFRANELMVERIGGKPRQAVELTGEDGEPVRLSIAFEDAIAKVYGHVDVDASEPE
jgi:hypothetical protein